MKIIALVAAFAFVMPPAFAGVELPDGRVIFVIDGDTITVDRVPWRLRGFDTPETGKALCETERALGDKATVRLGQLLNSGVVLLHTRSRLDKYGRVLGDVTVGGVNVGTTLIAEELARPYVGGSRRGWCNVS